MMIAVVFTFSLVVAASGQDSLAFREVEVPAVWKQTPPEIDQQGGYAWFVCRVLPPDSWRGRPLRIYAEASDDAREIYLNERRIGGFGEFPPAFRSGLGSERMFDAPAGSWSAGETHVVAVRLHQRQARERFNVAPVILFAGDQAMRLEGKWRMCLGDPSLAEVLRGPAKDAPVFETLIDAETAYRDRRRLPDEVGPLSARESLARMTTPADLQVELALADPDIGQPLQIKFDERGRMWVAEYLQYPDPAGLQMVSRDKFLRTVYDKVPQPPPHHDRGRDRISIHEDRDRDGYFETHQVFVEGLNMATSFAIGRGGVFVLNPPYLLFYADRDRDDRPDGDPEVLLEGFGLEDSHSLANSLRWGPDGWLYAAQGSTVTGDVRPYGSQQPPVHSLGQLIWRYHPETRRYEIFAEGGGNAFGVEIDQAGRIYSGHNGGDTRGFHYVQGGYYQKGFGKHGELSNPYAYGYFPPMGHPSAPRFTHTFLIYESPVLPERYRGVLFGAAPLQGHLVMSRVEPDRSSFQTSDIGYALTSDDSWFRPVEIREGPDGAIYVADFYEQRIDHASHYQGRVHRESGRIYRVRGREAPLAETPDLGALPSLQLLDVLGRGARAQRQQALRLLADRRDPEIAPEVRRILQEETGVRACEALWALYGSGRFSEQDALQLLEHPDRDVRAWTVRLLGDAGRVSPTQASALAELASREPDVQVRSQLASTARRLPHEQAMPILDRLTTRDVDAGDIHVPLLLWWAVEKQIAEHSEAVLQWMEADEVWRRPLVQEFLAERLARRLAEAGGRQNLLRLARLFQQAPDDSSRAKLMTGFEQAYQGRPVADLPQPLAEQLARLGGGTLALQLRQRQPDAVRQAVAAVSAQQGDPADLVSLIRVLGELKLSEAEQPLLAAATGAKSPEVRGAALAALQSFEDPAIARNVIAAMPGMSADALEAAYSLLASRLAWARLFVQTVRRGEYDPDAVPSHVLARLALYDDPELNDELKAVWADRLNTDAANAAGELARFEELLQQGSGNPYNGKKLFQAQCGKCHRLFNDGGQVGPDLTAYQRQDVKRMLTNVLYPSLEIREGFETFVVQTDDGRALNGFIADQDTQVVSLRGVDGQTLTVARDAIEEMFAIKTSVMPDGLLKALKEQEVRDLFAYLRATQPLP